MGQKPPTLPRIRSALAAKKALKERGWASVSDMLDSILVRIPPAMMQLGDVATVEGDQGLDALFVCARSEEHTSELQSLMRISYAVFCLKKKKENTTTKKEKR